MDNTLSQKSVACSGRTLFSDAGLGVQRLNDYWRVSHEHEAPRLLHLRTRVLQDLLRAFQLLQMGGRRRSPLKPLLSITQECDRNPTP